MSRLKRHMRQGDRLICPARPHGLLKTDDVSAVTCQECLWRLEAAWDPAVDLTGDAA
jgi:hypothetical protein